MDAAELEFKASAHGVAMRDPVSRFFFCAKEILAHSIGGFGPAMLASCCLMGKSGQSSVDWAPRPTIPSGVVPFPLSPCVPCGYNNSNRLVGGPIFR